MTAAPTTTANAAITEVLIIGAGISGLACAQALHTHGISAVVVDKGRGVGGRVATRRLGENGFDTGAQFFSARSAAFQATVAEWVTARAGALWTTGLLNDDGQLHHDGVTRYRGRPGMTAIVKYMAKDCDVRCGIEISQLDADAGMWTATTVDGQKIHARQLMLTTPLPQGLKLLQRGRQALPMADHIHARLAAVRYHTCVCLLADWPAANAPALPQPGALRSADPAEPVQWLLSHRQAGVRTVGEGLTIHLRGNWSDARYELTDEALSAEAVPAAQAAMQRWCGPEWIFATPPLLKKWRYAHVLNPLAEPCLAMDLGAPLMWAGDAFGDAPRIEGAWCSGVAAAQHIIAAQLD